MKKKLLFTALCSLISTSALAQIYECIDSRGNHSYSETPNGKNCRISNTSSGSFSVVQSHQVPEQNEGLDSGNGYDKPKKAGDSPQVKAARKNLQDAQKALEEGKKIRLARERNYVFYLNRIKGLEENVQARQRELDNILNQQ